MSIPAVKNFTNYNKYKNETGYTKQGELQEYLQNQNDVLTATAQVLLWQPETSYTAGQLVSSPSMTAGTLARVTTAGKTSDTEPTWTASGTTVTDGTVTWTVTKAVLVADLATSDEAKAGTATDKIITASTLKAAMDAAISSAIETAAKASETAAAASQKAAATSEANASASATSAKSWAEGKDSPDGIADTDSSTGYTQSAKSWAMAAKTSAASASALLEEINRPVYYLDSDGYLCEKIFVEVNE